MFMFILRCRLQALFSVRWLFNFMCDNSVYVLPATLYLIMHHIMLPYTEKLKTVIYVFQHVTISMVVPCVLALYNLTREHKGELKVVAASLRDGLLHRFEGMCVYMQVEHLKVHLYIHVDCLYIVNTHWLGCIRVVSLILSLSILVIFLLMLSNNHCFVWLNFAS